MNESVESRLRKYRTAAPPETLRNTILSKLPARGRRRSKETTMEQARRDYPWQQWRRRALVGCMVALVTLPVVLAGIAWSDQVAFDREVKTIRAKGFPATPADLDKSYPSPPKEQNAAEKYQAAFAAMEKTERGWMQEDFTRDIEKTPKQSRLAKALAQKLREYLDDNAETLRLLHEAADRPASHYPLDFSQGIQLPLPHLAKLRAAVRLLRIEALVAAEDGDTQRALDAVKAALAAADSVRQEPVLISQLVRVACHETTVDAINRIMRLSNCSEAELAQLGGYLREAQDPGGLTRALAGERALSLTSFEHPEQLLANVSEVQSLGPAVASAVAGLFHITGMASGDRKHYLALMDEIITNSQRPLHEAMSLMETMVLRLEAERTWLPGFTESLIVAVVQLSEAFARDAACVAAAETAVAVERYRLANSGTVPERLEQLVPAFLPAVPIDPFSGQSLHYQSIEDGYILNGVYQNRPGDTSNPWAGGQRGNPADLVFRVDHAPLASS
jgi:hypothetical protein